jgi:hypothetical protein
MTNTNITKTNTLILHNIGYFILLIINYYFYNFCKSIKKYRKCLKKKKCNISNKARRVYTLKHLSFFLIIYIMINFIIPINKYILKIPLIGSIYSIIILVIIIIELTFFSSIISSLNRQDCLDCLGFNKLSKNIISVTILKQKTKTLTLSIIVIYVLLVYI